MTDSVEAAFLRAALAEGSLERYDGMWIAIDTNMVVGSAREVRDLLAQHTDRIDRSIGPLFALISLGPRQ